MPADASIYGLIRPMERVELEKPEEIEAKRLQLRSMVDEQGLRALQRRQLEKGIADEEATAGAYREAAGDPDKLRTLLYGRGLYKPAQAAEKAALDAQKARGDIGKTQAETLKLNIVSLRDALVPVGDQASYDAWREGAAKLLGPDFARTIPAQFSPEIKLQNLMKAEDALKRLSPELRMQDTGSSIVPLNPYTGAQQAGTQVLAKTATPDAVLTDTRTRDEGAKNRGVTIRGQDLTDTRARETAEAGRWTNDLARGVQVNSATGETRPITSGGQPIGPNDDAPEAMLKAAGYADRMRKSSALLDKFAADGKPGLIETGAGGVPLVGTIAANVVRSPERQQYHQAAEDWVRAKLRQESGAVIADEEMAREIRTYFPMIGDSKETVAQKAQARKTAEQAMTTAAGRAGNRGGASSGWKVTPVP